MEANVTFRGIDLVVTYEVYGKDLPATYLDPPEYVELDINEVRVVDSEVDIYDLFLESDLDKISEMIREDE